MFDFGRGFVDGAVQRFEGCRREQSAGVDLWPRAAVRECQLDRNRTPT
jgi:hypothetical protein